MSSETSPAGDGDGPDVAIDESVRAGVDGDALLEKLEIDGDEIERRKAYSRFDEADADRLEAIAPDVREEKNAIVDEFYAHIDDSPQVRAVLDRSSMPREMLEAGQRQYLQRVVGGSYGHDYFASGARVGRLHDLLDLGPDAYLGQYAVYYEGVLDVLANRATDGAEHPETVDAVEQFRTEALSMLKAFLLDQQLAIDTYVDSYASEAEREARRQRELSNDVASRVGEPLSDLREATVEAADSAGEIADLTDEQSSQLREVASEADEMTATVEEVAATADQVAGRSEDAAETAAEGSESATDAVEAMAEIEAAATAVQEDTEKLQARVDEIRGVADVIADVAEQTNLLALNASIEAARAGKDGSGFAVVADEVKSLAGDAQEHAAEIEATVDEMAADSEETIESLETVTERVDDGTDRVTEAMERFEAIESAVEEVTDGIAEVATAMDSQAASVEEVAAMVEESSDAADDVANRAEQVAKLTDAQRQQTDDIAAATEELVE